MAESAPPGSNRVKVFTIFTIFLSLIFPGKVRESLTPERYISRVPVCDFVTIVCIIILTATLCFLSRANLQARGELARARGGLTGHTNRKGPSSK